MTLLHEPAPSSPENPHNEVIDYARMSDPEAVDALRYRLAALGTEGDNAIDLIGELRSNFVQNVHDEERHLVVSRSVHGTLQLSYIGFADISDASYDRVSDLFYAPHLSGLMEESGRGYSMMAVLSTKRGMNRLTNQAGEHIGVELWFNIRPDNDFPPLFDLEGL
jgi:hypothetical protein